MTIGPDFFGSFNGDKGTVGGLFNIIFFLCLTTLNLRGVFLCYRELDYKMGGKGGLSLLTEL